MNAITQHHPLLSEIRIERRPLEALDLDLPRVSPTERLESLTRRRRAVMRRLRV